MSNKIKELKEAIEKSSISYTRLDDLGFESTRFSDGKNNFKEGWYNEN